MTERRLTFTKHELDAMPQERLVALLASASKVEATFVVRRADGSIKYDDPALAGTYHEHALEAEHG